MIPVTFPFEDKEIKGYLSPVNGSAGIWHLMSEGYYYGQLSNGSSGWQFFFQKYGYDQQLAEYFGSCVIAWHDCH